MLDCHDVLDLLLDQARGRASPGDFRSHQSTYSFHAACQQPKVITTRLIYKGKNTFTYNEVIFKPGGLYHSDGAEGPKICGGQD